MNKPRILFIVPSLTRAGAEKQVVDLANGLTTKGFECHLASFESNRDQLDRLNQKEVTYHPLRRKWKFDLGVAADLAKLIELHHIDVLHCTLSIGIFYGVIAARRSSRSPAVIAGVHTTLSRNLKDEFLERTLYRYQLRSVDRVVFVCRRQMEYWLKRDPGLEPLGTVIYNGVDHTEFEGDAFENAGTELRKRLHIPEAARTMCCVAAFRPEKAQGNIVRALANLGDIQPEVHLLLAGEGGEAPAVKQLADDLNLSDRVHFLGKLADVRPVLAASEFSVISSVAVETFSFAMLESMSMGTPVLSTRIGGAAEAIIPDRTGALAEPNDINDLTNALRGLLDNPSRLRTFGRNARNLVEEKFSYQTMIDSTSTLVMEVYLENQAGR